MAKRKVGVIAECVCDLPNSSIEEYDIDIVYFLVQTDSGVFTDTDEITAANLISYMEAGGTKSRSSAPSAEVYVQAFRKKLERYEDIVLPTISSKISESYKHATDAAESMGDEGKHIHIFDTGHLSTGLGHMVLRAAQLAKQGSDAEKIIADLAGMRNKVSTSFITKNVDYLYRNGLVNGTVKKLCGMFNAHPILEMKNGEITARSIKFGNYEKACLRYIREQLDDQDRIDKTMAFITHVHLSTKDIEVLKDEINRTCRFKEILVTNASATISSNCGPGTVGVLFVRK